MSVCGGRIAIEPTETSTVIRPAVPPQDAEASLRAQLSAQIANAQSDLENQLAQLRHAASITGDAGAYSQAQTQLRALARLQQRIAGADISGLMTVRGEVAASVAATQTLVEQAQPGLAASQSAQAALYEASAAADRTVRDFNRDFYERRIFDPYLKFSSAADEEAYRQREAERQRKIQEARAEHTPQGELRAVNLSLDQLNDAGAHGADRSPEFKAHKDALLKSSDALTSAIGASQATVKQQVEQKNPPAKDAVDPLASVGAKSPDAKGAVAALIAAGLSAPQSDNLGHGVTDQAVKPTSPTRAI